MDIFRYAKSHGRGLKTTLTDDLQGLGDVLAQLRQARTATAETGGRSGKNHPLAR